MSDGVLLSDAAMVERGGPESSIGMSAIKARRLSQLRVKTSPEHFVGECVPFYFCPRSVMLYLIHMGNHPELAYQGGQGPIVHLEADLNQVIDWAIETAATWAFTLSNAGSAYAEFRSDRDRLHEINWSAVSNTDFRTAEVKEGKQAEFLLLDRVPLELINSVGVRDSAIKAETENALSSLASPPPVIVRPNWYY